MLCQLMQSYGYGMSLEPKRASKVASADLGIPESNNPDKGAIDGFGKKRGAFGFACFTCAPCVPLLLPACCLCYFLTVGSVNPRRATSLCHQDCPDLRNERCKSWHARPKKSSCHPSRSPFSVGWTSRQAGALWADEGVQPVLVALLRVLVPADLAPQVRCPD